MFRISRSLSVVLTQIVLVILAAALGAAAFTLPSLYSLLYGEAALENNPGTFMASMICLYTSILPAGSAIVFIYSLLESIKRGNVFTKENTARIRYVSWCCFAEAVIYFVLGFWLFGAFIISFGALFMCMLLRVIKNVIEEATEIKDENEYTI